jgi:hypothetical protein
VSGDNQNDDDRIKAWAAERGHEFDPTATPKLTQQDRSAQEQHRMNSTDWVAVGKATRERICEQEYAKLRDDPDYAGNTDEAIKAHVAVWHSDQAILMRGQTAARERGLEAQRLHDEAETAKAQTALVQEGKDLRAKVRALTASSSESSGREATLKQEIAEKDKAIENMAERFRSGGPGRGNH